MIQAALLCRETHKNKDNRGRGGPAWRLRLRERPDRTQQFDETFKGAFKNREFVKCYEAASSRQSRECPRKKTLPDARQKPARGPPLTRPSAIRMQIWKLALCRAEQGNLTSCSELSNVFEISKYSISANSTGNGSGIILPSSPGPSPDDAITRRVIYLPAARQTTVWWCWMRPAPGGHTPHPPAGPSSFRGSLQPKAVPAIPNLRPDCGKPSGA